MSLKIFLAVSFLAMAPSAIASAETPTKCVVTIKSVQLMNAAGEWITVIEPDHQVDLMGEEAGLSFFNQGRIPPGEYKNFKISLFERLKLEGPDMPEQYVWLDENKKNPDHSAEITGLVDFEKMIRVNRDSFIGVWFVLNLEGSLQRDEAGKMSFVPPKNVVRATVMVDDESIVVPSPQIALAI